MILTPTQRAILSAFSPSSPALRLPPNEDTNTLAENGLLVAITPIWLKISRFAITAKGRELLEAGR